MKIQSKDFEGLKSIVRDCDHYKKWQTKEAEILAEIAELKSKGEYIERDLYEWLISIRQALYLGMCGNHVIDGYMHNKPYMHSSGGNSCLTDIVYRDQNDNYIRSEYVYEIHDSCLN